MGVLEEQSTLIGPGGKQFGRAAEQPGGGVVAAGDHGEREAEDPQQGHLVASVTGRDEVADGVVAGLAAPAFDEAREVLEELTDRIGGGQRVPFRVGGDDGLGPPVEARPIGHRNTEVVGDNHARERLEQLGDDVAPALSAELLDPLDHERPNLGFERDHPPRGEALGDKAAKGRVRGWVEHDHRRGIGEPRGVDVAVVEGQALGRRERGRVARRGEHVGEPRQHPIVAVGHVVDRVGVPEVGVHLERIAPSRTRPRDELD